MARQLVAVVVNPKGCDWTCESSCPRHEVVVEGCVYPEGDAYAVAFLGEPAVDGWTEQELGDVLVEAYLAEQRRAA
jgi:hypothetical protein